MNEGAVATLDTRPANPFAVEGRSTGQNVQVAMVQSRQAQEVQAAMVVAKKFPRDEAAAYGRIIKACQRPGLAEVAMYSYPKGGTKVTGPSIRLAEAMAQSWGNLDFGILELEQGDGESTVMAYCWDLETNTRQTKVFQVPHHIKSGGGLKKLTDPREIYELVANQGARRVRACILGIIPGDIVDSAVEECDKTMTKGSTIPLTDRLRKMALTFEEEFGVSIPQIEKKLGHKLDATSEREFITLKKIYVSLRDGMSKKEQWFETVDTVQNAEVPSTPNSNAAAPEAGRSAADPSPSAAAPTVPNETLGETKPRTTKKAAATAQTTQITPRQAAANRLRQLAQEAGKTEEQLIAVLAEHQMVMAGARLDALPLDTLTPLISDWENIAATLARVQ